MTDLDTLFSKAAFSCIYKRTGISIKIPFSFLLIQFSFLVQIRCFCFIFFMCIFSLFVILVDVLVCANYSTNIIILVALSVGQS